MVEKDTCPSSKMASEGSLPRSSLSTSTRGAGSIDKASWAEPGRFMRCYLCTGVHDLGASAPSFRPHLSAITAPCSPCCSWPTAGLELWNQPLHPPTCSLTSKSVKTEFQQLSSRSQQTQQVPFSLENLQPFSLAQECPAMAELAWTSLAKYSLPSSAT